jgi:uncharacterized membrane protein
VTDRALRALLALLALAGAAIAAYLLYVRYSHAELVCTTGGCETVQSSRYAELLGVPIPALALLGFGLIGSTALGVGLLARAAGAALALAALAFSGYLLVIQLVVIEAVCDWCLVSDLIVTLLAAVALGRLLQASSLSPPPAVPARGRSERARRDWRGEASA